MITKLTSSILVLLTLSIVSSIPLGIFSPKDLEQLQKAHHESSEYMSKEAKEEDAVLFVGPTGSGTSTLINYLIGNELVVEKSPADNAVTIKKVDGNSRGPEIGSGSTSRTIIPTRWISRKLPHLAIWDSPGFDDSRGPVQDITEAFYINQLLQKAKTLRIVLTVDINKILRGNTSPFESALSAVEDLLRYKNKIHSSVLSVIFTKVPENFNDVPVNMKLINRILSEQLLSKAGLSQSSKDIVEYLINNNSRIGLFKRAKLGLVTSDIDVNIFRAITSSSFLEKDALKELRPRISEKSKSSLFRSRNILVRKEAFYDLENFVGYVIDKKVHDLVDNYDPQGGENTIRTKVTQLNRIGRLLSALGYESDFYRKMEIVRSIDPEIKKQIEGHNLLERIQLMETVDKLLNMEESKQFADRLQAVLSSSEAKVRGAIASGI